MGSMTLYSAFFFLGNQLALIQTDRLTSEFKKMLWVGMAVMLELVVLCSHILERIVY